MKTEVKMARPFQGGQIRQKSKNEMLCATDLIKIGNVKRKELGLGPFNLQMFLKRKSTLEFIKELQKENKHVIQKDRKNGTWVHPLLFMDIALALNPKFKVEVYKWIQDELIKYRNDSGDSYKKMIGTIYEKAPARDFNKTVQKLAGHIRKEIGVKDWNEATEDQLKLRDKVHDAVSLVVSLSSSASWKAAALAAIDHTINK